MAFVDPEHLLIATAAVPVTTALVTLVSFVTERRDLGLFAARFGGIGGAILGALLCLAFGQVEPESSEQLHVSLWKWLSFATPNSPAVILGLDGSWLKSAVVSLAGGLVVLGLWKANAASGRHFSDDAILTTSLLYASGTVFVFAPNAVQGFLGWGATSSLALVLMRLSHPASSGDGRSDHRNDSSPPSLTSVSKPMGEGSRLAQRLGRITSTADWTYRELFWEPLTDWFPRWLIEQCEFLAQTATPIQLLACVLGAFSILLVWLI